ncbi:MAG TPA: hypothetical protein VIS51_06965 [Solirubrobacterales bacterium]
MNGILPLQSVGDPSGKDNQSAEEHSLSPSIHVQLAPKQRCYPDCYLAEQTTNHRARSNVGQCDPTVSKFGRDKCKKTGRHA